MSGDNILLVEDDKNISKLVKYNLEKAGYNCLAVITGEDGFEILDKEKINLIILDVMLPKMDGFEVCRLIKQEDLYSQIPIIMLTARAEEIDRIVGLELGADDYIAKPFSPRELVLRVKAILKRSVTKTVASPKEILNFDKLKIDIPRHKVLVNAKEVKLTAMEFDLLVILLNRKGRVQSREQLLNDVWGIEADVTTRTVDTHVKRLRQKLGRYGKFIETVRGYGYRFFEQE
jgi:DNA-binding response OmpR family regulator